VRRLPPLITRPHAVVGGVVSPVGLKDGDDDDHGEDEDDHLLRDDVGQLLAERGLALLVEHALLLHLLKSHVSLLYQFLNLSVLLELTSLLHEELVQTHQTNQTHQTRNAPRLGDVGIVAAADLIGYAAHA
jgi:hypothetical protein